MKDVLVADFVAEHGKPDVIITDPPRAGMHPDVVNRLMEIEAEKIVYVSCNAATQARDLLVLKEKYDTVKIQPVDMFPHTQHVENVVLLVLRKD
jgi:23S rRNA (uracil1939-C5)-methyltransferase